MQSQDKIKRHATLVDHMATALELDLEETTMQGRLQPDDLADAVLRCTACTNPEDCDTWLAAHKAPQQSTPSYCRNQDLFRSLKGAQAD
jgi:hypothetical protein